MKTSLPFLCLSLVTVSGTDRLRAAEFENLFNGNDLAGWEGNPDLWSAKDGMIVGNTVGHPLNSNTFLVWKGGEPDNFILKAKVRVEGDNNSGIQYRSEIVDPAGFVLKGYQCDIHPSKDYLGMLYGEKTPYGIMAQRGQKVAFGADGTKTVEGAVGNASEFKIGDWNEYTVIAAGTRVLHQVNGVTTVDVTDESPVNRPSGVIGLQVHAGPPMTAFAKDIQLEKLSLAEATAALEEAAGKTVPVKQSKARKKVRVKAEAAKAETPNFGEKPLPTWIWGQDQDKTQYVRRTFALNAPLKAAHLFASCDNILKLWINGTEIASSSEWQTPVSKDVLARLKIGGKNVIAVQASNAGGVSALVVKLVLTSADGKSAVIMTGDDGWRLTDKEERGWQDASFNDLTWSKPQDRGKLGVQPWGIPGAGGGGGGGGSPLDPENLRIADGFEAELLYTVPKGEQGSWVSLTKDPKGRFIASDQDGKGLYRVTVTDSTETTDVEVEKIPVEISGAQGLVWAHDSLYVHASGRGLFRLTDSNSDDMLDTVEQLPGARGGGEHGNHGVILSDDGENLFVEAGNHTDLPKEVVVGSAVASWDEDLLLPRDWDANGHARGRMAPGGWICRVTPDAKAYRVHCMGFRNEYDIALNRFGDLFTYDADMEWDMGSPWYRPTRICHAVSGADFGWRSGTGKWPVYYEDSLPPLVDIGPGSPTGVVCGTGAKFPAEYQDAIFALDWTFGTIYAIHPIPSGAGYTAKSEEFVAGAPLPVTDAIIGDDGALYFTIGGRGTQSALYRVNYTGEASTAPATGEGPPEAAKARALRRSLEAFHGRQDPKAVDAAWPHLRSPDRFLRHAARVAIEAQPVDSWVERALSESDPQARITASVALARSGKKEFRARQIASLLTMKPEALEESQFLGLLRAYALTFIRLGAPEGEEKAEVIAQLSPFLPSKSANLNTELVRVLVSLDAPGIVEKTMALITNPSKPEVPDWGELIARNGGYGGGIRKMLDNPTPAREIGYAFMLRNIRYGWTMPERRAYVGFLNDAGKYPGGNSYGGFLRNMRDEALANASAAERAALSDLTGEALTPKLDFTITPPKGPGRAWTLASALATLEAPGALSGRDFAAGRNLFHATACAGCHRFDGTGGAIGPDLTTVRNKFSTRDLLESLIEPSKVISDQYGSSTVKLQDGSSATGIVVEHGDVVEVYTSDPKAPPTIANQSDVASITRVPVSQMPPGLINLLSPDELRNLLAYLLSRGNPDDPMFRQ